MTWFKRKLTKSVTRKLDLLMGSASWGRQQLQELQWKKFTQLITHAYDSCPYYHQLLKNQGLHPKRDFHNLDCISKIPILEKTTIQKHHEQMRTSDSMVRGIELNSTGGSTGQPLNFFSGPELPGLGIRKSNTRLAETAWSF